MQNISITLHAHRWIWAKMCMKETLGCFFTLIMFMCVCVFFFPENVGFLCMDREFMFTVFISLAQYHYPLWMAEKVNDN